jgi:hypothetical protein
MNFPTHHRTVAIIAAAGVAILAVALFAAHHGPAALACAL